MNFIRRITNFGKEYCLLRADRRNIILTNYISLIASLALLILIGALYLFYGFNPGAFFRLLIAALFFLIPLFLNRFGLIIISRLVLSWLVPTFVFAITIFDLKGGEMMAPSSFVGLRLFLLAGFCFPFLIFNLKDRWNLVAGLAAPVLSILFFDQIFSIFGVSYLQNNPTDPYYEFSNVRAFISMIAVGFSLYFLKSSVEDNEQKNQHLLLELQQKNALIQQQAEADVNKLNLRLNANLQELRISEARFRGAFEYSAAGMALVSLEGHWLRVNKALCKMVGYSDEELLSLSVSDITWPDDLIHDEIFYAQLRTETRTNYPLEKRYIHKSGSVVWVNINASVIKDSEGKLVYFVAQIEDITEDKLIAEKLALQEANLRTTINNIELLIWSVDREFRLLMFNKRFEEHMQRNYREKLRLGEPMFKAPTPPLKKLVKKWENFYLQVLEGKHISFEDEQFGQDFQFSLSPIIEHNNVVGISIYAENVTNRKARDKELIEAREKIAELRLMALRSVMSPHFIFNVLNSIQYFIANNERLNAINYLSTFSKLVRSILAHSINNKIKLLDEIEMLKNYIQLEMIRFENKFSFSLAVSNDIELDSVVIPSLLIQPYVENAILHGLYNKEGKGKLEIRINRINNNIRFEVEDDGVGRQVAMKLREQNLLNHNSMGIRITEERLKLMNLGQHTFTIEDLTDINGPCGTRVSIEIPFDEE
ncbi:MAG TPA: PAS domain S-box protein [Cyclobacteriaceae bacterium]|jgi:PAS domain S-box-containing protein|nr:PAS domain S-box protein [Cyclobacteriaceae bacterium]